MAFPFFSIYPNPKIYDPDNFSPENKSERSPYTYLAFGQGPRACIATRFAVMQVKVAMVKLLYNFKLVKGPKTPEKLTHDPRSPQALPLGGPWLKLEKRIGNVRN